ncbi:uncharacterized protein LOC109138370 [Larimichthys crocea]|nr:uncharacterized protein LOC109138370 [Larimichthys crocea]XP_019119949.1 uncharacterized protein LOC109139776 [Larimichthys crocea]XP_027129379.1 uncharacterized protein LOC109139776 [Larimichthys crocea]XP_027146529.1 uncharacterized protein LOC109138370 [Larimichthys crocea]
MSKIKRNSSNRNSHCHTMDRDSMIELYFRLGMKYKDILKSLALEGFIISERHLHRLLRARSLHRRRYDLDAGIDFIVDQLQGSGKDHGYRWMYTKCIQHGIRIRKEDVRILLSLLDPVASQLRRTRRLSRRQYFAQGPNFVWHIDSYDKLKPYGICLNGCIDGFSRKVMWLRAARTNSDPKVIGGYFVETLERCGGCPRLVRTDMGTENVVVRDIQRYLRRDDVDDRAAERSYVTGASTANQRIESWWGVMRKQGIEPWITAVGELKDEGFFSGDFVDKALSQFCFMSIIQELLNDIQGVWNAHRIRPSKNPNVPSGIPDVMYMAPHLWGAENCLVPLTEDLTACKHSCTFLSSVPCDVDLFDLCTIIMEESSLEFPSTMSDAVDLYIQLRDTVRPQLFGPI